MFIRRGLGLVEFSACRPLGRYFIVARCRRPFTTHIPYTTRYVTLRDIAQHCAMVRNFCIFYVVCACTRGWAFCECRARCWGPTLRRGAAVFVVNPAVTSGSPTPLRGRLVTLCSPCFLYCIFTVVRGDFCTGRWWWSRIAGAQRYSW